MDAYTKALIGVDPRTSDAAAAKHWKAVTKHVCKPCWELKYCPYGPLVEQFPLPRLTRAEAISHNEFLKEQLAQGKYDKSPKRKAQFLKEVKQFRPSKYPERNSSEEKMMECNIFGHFCPVFLVNEPFNELAGRRNISRSISFKTKIRVARRDNYTCQECGKHLLETDLEFDHIIPHSLGGTSDERNIRLLCFECNRTKGNKMAP